MFHYIWWLYVVVNILSIVIVWTDSQLPSHTKWAPQSHTATFTTS